MPRHRLCSVGLLTVTYREFTFICFKLMRKNNWFWIKCGNKMACDASYKIRVHFYVFFAD